RRVPAHLPGSGVGRADRRPRVAAAVEPLLEADLGEVGRGAARGERDGAAERVARIDEVFAGGRGRVDRDRRALPVLDVAGAVGGAELDRVCAVVRVVGGRRNDDGRAALGASAVDLVLGAGDARALVGAGE